VPFFRGPAGAPCQAWKDKHIHGFTPLAGNWPGQGLLYAVFFTGLDTVNS
jgi:lecithin-cholesterol acyltransferase